MAFVQPHDRVLENSTSNSQTVFSVSGAVDTSYNAFSASMSIGDTTIGGVVESGVAFKSGILTYSAAGQVTVGPALESKGTFSSSGVKQVFMGLPAALLPIYGSNVTLPTGRLTLTSGTPYMATSVAAAATVYYTPIGGGSIPIWDGVGFRMRPFTELSHLLSDATLSPAAAANNAQYDLYVWDRNGSLVLSRSSSWQFGGAGGSSTARGTGIGGCELSYVSGIAVNKQSIANGAAAGFGTYVGTVRTNGTATCDFVYGASGTAASFGLWNAYNRSRVTSMGADSTSSWSYTSATVRQANASAVNQVNFITGAATDGIDVTYLCNVAPTTVIGATVYIGVAIDSTTVFDKRAFMQNPTIQVFGGGLAVPAAYAPQLGWHYISANEASDGTNNGSFVGQNRQSLVFALDM